MLEHSVTSYNLSEELKIDYITLHETHQSSGKTHSNPERISQNGAVVVWALMHLGCYSPCQTNAHARLDSVDSQRWRHKCRWTHRHTRSPDPCSNAHSGATLSSQQKYTEKIDVFPSFSSPIRDSPIEPQSFVGFLFKYYFPICVDLAATCSRLKTPACCQIV